MKSVNEWFGDLIERTAVNSEVRAYIGESQEIARLNPPRRLELRRLRGR